MVQSGLSITKHNYYSHTKKKQFSLVRDEVCVVGNSIIIIMLYR